MTGVANEKHHGGCDCADRVNAGLVARNTVLTEKSIINFETGAVRQSLVVATERLKSTPKRTKIITVLPSFCPFCGGRIAKGEPTP